MSASARATANALDLLAGLVLEDGRTWGEAAWPWQLEDARAILEPASPTPLHFLTRPRGASKTTDLAGVAIAALVEQLPPNGRAYAVAADRDQARLLVDALAGFVARTPGLAGALEVAAFRVIANGSGATLEVLAADGPSAYGLRPHLVIVDELAQWPDTPSARLVWEAVYSAMAKMPGARLVVLTSAGDPAHPSHKILEHASAHSRWRLHEVPGPCPWLDPKALAEQRALLTESQYARLHLNRWTSGEDRLTSLEDLRACVTLDGPLEPTPGRTYVVGVDLGINRDRTAATVCHLEPVEERWEGVESYEQGQRVVLDRLDVWAGSRGDPVKLDAVEEWLDQAVASFNGAQVVVDPWQAVGLAQRLRGKGVRVEDFTFSSASVGRLASTLHLLLRNRALALPDDPELIDELANVRLRETSPGVIRMDHDPGRHDDRAIALALAATSLLARPRLGARVGHYVHVGRGRGRRTRFSSSSRRDPVALLRKMAERGDHKALEYLERHSRGSRPARHR